MRGGKIVDGTLHSAIVPRAVHAHCSVVGKWTDITCASRLAGTMAPPCLPLVALRGWLQHCHAQCRGASARVQSWPDFLTISSVALT